MSSVGRHTDVKTICSQNLSHLGVHYSDNIHDSGQMYIYNTVQHVTLYDSQFQQSIPYFRLIRVIKFMN